MKKFLTLALIAFLLTGCNSDVNSEKVNSAPVVGPSNSPPKFSFSLFNLHICYPVNSLSNLDATIKKIEKGLLSVKDLDEPLSEAAMSFDISRMMLASDTLYKDSPEAEQVLPESELPEFLDFLNQKNIWFSKVRVKLLDRGTLDIELLKAEILKVQEKINSMCKK